MSGKHRKKEERLVPLSALALGGSLSLILGAFILSPPAQEAPTPITSIAAPTTSSTLTVPSPVTTAPTSTARATAPLVTSATTTASASTAAQPTYEETVDEPVAEVADTFTGLVAAAREYVGDGIPYVWGGKDQSGMDCSGFIWRVLRDEGYDVPYRNSAALRSWTIPVSAEDARPGDLVFWPGHVGLYAGGQDLIDMGSGPGTVAERTLWGTPTFGRLP